ncbi:MAG: hypothetical protein K1060chlam2_00971 [Chlamydiae bacterium]|nr:hypothetical protein [Chlamydiota bacterium]
MCSITTPIYLPIRESEGAKSRPLSSAMPGVYRRFVTDTSNLSLYGSPASPNSPSVTNLLTLPGDLYTSVTTLGKSILKGDNEAALDSTMRLAGVAPNIVSSVGSGITLARNLQIIPATKAISLFLPIACIIGIALCVFEGIVDSISIVRELRFIGQFDFSIFEQFNMLLDFNAVNSPKALKNLTSMLNKNPKKFVKLFGESQTRKIRTLFNTIEAEVAKEPLFYRGVLTKYKSRLDEVAGHFLIYNLAALESDYLELSPKEVNEIRIKGDKKFKGSTRSKEEKLEKMKQSALHLKHKKLARRVQPWMANEANLKTPSLLKGLLEKDPDAVKEGLTLFKDLERQALKKMLINGLGILAFIATTGAIITLLVGCPVAIPYFLIGAAIVIGLLRVGVSATLCRRGWKIDWYAFTLSFIPGIISRFMPKVHEEEVRGKFRARAIVPLNKSYERVMHDYRLAFIAKS